MERRRIQLLYQAIKLFKHVSQVLQIILRAGWVEGEYGQCTICTDWIFRWYQVRITLAKPLNIHCLFFLLKLIAKIDKRSEERRVGKESRWRVPVSQRTRR